MLRIVDNENFPAFFNKDGFKYSLKIEKMENPNCKIILDSLKPRLEFGLMETKDSF